MSKRTLLFCCLTVLSCFFIACDNPVDIEGEVSIKKNEKLPQVRSLSLIKTTNKKYFILSWDAISRDVSYQLYFKQDGKLSSVSIGYIYSSSYYDTYPQNRYKYNVADGEQIPNDDFDKWYVRIESIDTSSPGSYCFGVRSIPEGSEFLSSDITWSEPFTVTKASNVVSVTAVKTTSGSIRYIIATWDAVKGLDSYSARQEMGGTTYAVESAQNDYVYSTIDGSSSVNQNSSKWSLKSYSTSASRIGVIATSSDISVVPGDIVWSNIIN
ncbi:hypothetical protein FACS1894142_8280 [Spirochaetia bacterium]|nr:hypothetical protein FACS1894142_8280 [Spirochaetia bacterium]